jgi:hypothetical protein
MCSYEPIIGLYIHFLYGIMGAGDFDGMDDEMRDRLDGMMIHLRHRIISIGLTGIFHHENILLFFPHTKCNIPMGGCGRRCANWGTRCCEDVRINGENMQLSFNSNQRYQTNITNKIRMQFAEGIFSLNSLMFP